jgi:hypothetical protein
MAAEIAERALNLHQEQAPFLPQTREETVLLV